MRDAFEYLTAPFAGALHLPKDKRKNRPRSVMRPEEPRNRGGLSTSGTMVWSGLALFVFAAAVYVRTLGNGFVNLDDGQYLVENSNIQQGVNGAMLRWAFTTYHAANWHPLTWISHALDVQLFGMAGPGHHAVSVFLHAINAVLLFWLLWRATDARGPSLVVAALFAVHPINVECVAWAAERKSLLCTFFSLLTLGAYGWYARKPSLSRYSLIFTLFAAALMAKPMAVTLPFAMLLLDVWPLGRVAEIPGASCAPALGRSVEHERAFSRLPFARLVLEKLPLFVLSAASSVVTMAAQRSGQAVALLTEVPLGARIANAVCAYVLYLWHAIWPVDLAVYYPSAPRSPLLVGLSSAVLVVISFWVWRERRTRPYLLVGWCWYLGTLVPVIGLVQVGRQSMADRYAYIPLLGIFMMVVWRLAEFANTKRTEERGAPNSQHMRISAWRVATVVILLAFAALTLRQTGYWKNSLTLWSHTLAITHDNATAEDNYAIALMYDRREGEALEHFRNAMRMQPQEPKTHLAVGALLAKRGDAAGAIAEFNTALPLTHDPQDLRAIYESLGVIYRQTGDYAASADNFGKLAKLDPNDTSAMVALGTASLLQSADRMEKEIQAHPTAEGYRQLGTIWQQAGEESRAQEAFAAAATLSAAHPGRRSSSAHALAN
jgi:tetratricopeptide (TPR) repeat protein